MSIRAPLTCALVLALAGAAGCAEDNSLGGSVEELFELEVSAVEVLRNEEAFQVSYYRNRGAEVDLVVRLTVALEGLELSPGQRLDLAGEYAPGHPRTRVIHLPGGEPARIFPAVKQGDLRLREGGAPEEPTRGDFSMSFEQTGDFGSGRTLYGNFRALAKDAGFGDG